MTRISLVLVLAAAALAGCAGKGSNAQAVVGIVTSGTLILGTVASARAPFLTLEELQSEKAVMQNAVLPSIAIIKATADNYDALLADLIENFPPPPPPPSPGMIGLRLAPPPGPLPPGLTEWPACSGKTSAELLAELRR